MQCLSHKEIFQLRLFWSLVCCASARLSYSSYDVAVVIVSWCTFDAGHLDGFAADHQTTELLFHCLVLEGVNERIHADIQIGQEHRGDVHMSKYRCIYRKERNIVV